MKAKTLVILTLSIALGFFAGFVALSKKGSPTSDQASVATTVVDGKQTIEITARGGYSPRSITAQANMPTVLKVKTFGTFDCSAALAIPSIGYQKFLPASGETLIEISPQKPGTTLTGVCGMGMYNFSIKFS